MNFWICIVAFDFFLHLNFCIWAFTFEHLNRRKRRSGDTAGEVEELDEEGEEEDEFGMLAVRGSSGAIRSTVPIVMFCEWLLW